MIYNLDAIKLRYENEFIELVKKHKVLENLLDSKYLHYTTDLIYSRTSKKYTFNVTFVPINEKEPYMTIPFINCGHANGYIIAPDNEEEELRIVDYLKNVL